VHAPNYADKSVWPELLEADRAAYTKEQWPSARVLVWNPTGAAAKARKVDNDMLSDPANWIQEDGKPAETAPDEETDVIFPSATSMSIDSRGILSARHVTVQSGAMIGNMGNPVIRGNIWIKKNIEVIKNPRAFAFSSLHSEGNKDTFTRQDTNITIDISNMMHFKKQADKSTEWIGKWKIGDQLYVHSGIFIVGPGSYWGLCDRFNNEINGTLVLGSGATVEAHGNNYRHNHDFNVGATGKILAGTPERPLKSDCVIGVSFKADGTWNDAGGKAVGYPGVAGFAVHEGGALMVHSADPAKARLVFRWPRNPPGTRTMDAAPPEEAALRGGIRLRLWGDVQLDGVEFNDVLKGGIILHDPALAKQWKNVTLGTGNFGKTLEELVTQEARPPQVPKK
jgi:hypothetical protein